MRIGRLLIFCVFVLSGIFFWMAHKQLGLTYYVKAWVYTKVHPESRAMFRAEKTPLSITGIYIDYREGVIRLWRDWRIVSYQVGEGADALIYRGCDIPGYDESKMQKIAVQSMDEVTAMAKKGDYVVVVLDSLETKNVKTVLVTDYWPFVVDTRLEVQCNERNL